MRRPLTLAAVSVLGVALFAAAYCQAPLYYSNQNQYFVHGFADADRADPSLGFLHDDWLANTLDPTPLFSLFVRITVQFAHPWVFHVVHALLLGIYAAALLGIFTSVVGPETAARRWPVFLLLIVALHAGIVRWMSYRVFGTDYPWYFQAGVAGQYVLGPMLQPSVFGVLLVAAIALFARGSPYAAAALIAAGATLHSTYLLPGALITLGMLAAQIQQRKFGLALRTAALAMLLVVPSVAFVLIQFAPTSPKLFEDAQSILVNSRIPHHALPRLWLDPIAGLQIAWLVFGTALVWRTPLFTVMVVPLGLAAVLTAIQVASGSDAIALLFPWRVSSILMPVATAVVLARFVALKKLPLDGHRVIAAVGILGLAGAGIWIVAAGQAFRAPDNEAELFEFVRTTRKSGDVYLLPVQLPNLAKATFGSSSNDFKPLAAKRADPRVIPVDLQRFRLSTRTPLFIDFKAIPYKDVEVIEWFDRMQLAQNWLDALREGREGTHLAEMHGFGVTHVVLPVGRDYSQIGTPGLQRVHEDAAYQVYRLEAGRP